MFYKHCSSYNHISCSRYLFIKSNTARLLYPDFNQELSNAILNVPNLFQLFFKFSYYDLLLTPVINQFLPFALRSNITTLIYNKSRNVIQSLSLDESSQKELLLPLQNKLSQYTQEGSQLAVFTNIVEAIYINRLIYDLISPNSWASSFLEIGRNIAFLPANEFYDQESWQPIWDQFSTLISTKLLDPQNLIPLVALIIASLATKPVLGEIKTTAIATNQTIIFDEQNITTIALTKKGDEQFSNSENFVLKVLNMLTTPLVLQLIFSIIIKLITSNSFLELNDIQSFFALEDPESKTPAGQTQSTDFDDAN